MPVVAVVALHEPGRYLRASASGDPQTQAGTELPTEAVVMFAPARSVGIRWTTLPLRVLSIVPLSVSATMPFSFVAIFVTYLPTWTEDSQPQAPAVSEAEEVAVWYFSLTVVRQVLKARMTSDIFAFLV